MTKEEKRVQCDSDDAMIHAFDVVNLCDNQGWTVLEIDQQHLLPAVRVSTQ